MSFSANTTPNPGAIKGWRWSSYITTIGKTCNWHYSILIPLHFRGAYCSFFLPSRHSWCLFSRYRAVRYLVFGVSALKRIKRATRLTWNALTVWCGSSARRRLTRHEELTLSSTRVELWGWVEPYHNFWAIRLPLLQTLSVCDLYIYIYMTHSDVWSSRRKQHNK